MKTSLKHALVQTIYRTRLSRVWPNSLAGMGAILALHRVKPSEPKAFAPNLSLEITPAFLDQTIRQVLSSGFEIVSLDEMCERLTTGRSSKRFVCFTLDDGYADNYTYSAPVFEAHQAPFAIYTTTGLLDRTALFWWMLLEDVIDRETSVTLQVDGAEESRRTTTFEEKTRAFNDFHGIFRGLSAKACLAAAQSLADDYDIDPCKLCADHGMTWDMAREITKKGLGAIEAHTVRHLALSLQEPDDIRAEMDQCCSRIEEQTGYRPRHFAYPFGDMMAAGAREFDMLRSLSILSATTTIEGMLLPNHAGELTALPRLTLNGYYQSSAYIDVILRGISTFFTRPVKRL